MKCINVGIERPTDTHLCRIFIQYLFLYTYSNDGYKNIENRSKVYTNIEIHLIYTYIIYI